MGGEVHVVVKLREVLLIHVVGILVWEPPASAASNSTGEGGK